MTAVLPMVENQGHIADEAPATKLLQSNPPASYVIQVVACGETFDVPVTSNTRSASVLREVAEMAIPAEQSKALGAIEAVLFYNNNPLTSDTSMGSIPRDAVLHLHVRLDDITALRQASMYGVQRRSLFPAASASTLMPYGGSPQQMEGKSFYFESMPFGSSSSSAGLSDRGSPPRDVPTVSRSGARPSWGNPGSTYIAIQSTDEAPFNTTMLAGSPMNQQVQVMSGLQRPFSAYTMNTSKSALRSVPASEMGEKQGFPPENFLTIFVHLPKAYQNEPMDEAVHKENADLFRSIPTSLFTDDTKSLLNKDKGRLRCLCVHENFPIRALRTLFKLPASLTLLQADERVAQEESKTMKELDVKPNTVFFFAAEQGAPVLLLPSEAQLIKKFTDEEAKQSRCYSVDSHSEKVSPVQSPTVVQRKSVAASSSSVTNSAPTLAVNTTVPFGPETEMEEKEEMDEDAVLQSLRASSAADYVLVRKRSRSSVDDMKAPERKNSGIVVGNPSPPSAVKEVTVRQDPNACGAQAVKEDSPHVERVESADCVIPIDADVSSIKGSEEGASSLDESITETQPSASTVPPHDEVKPAANDTPKVESQKEGERRSAVPSPSSSSKEAVVSPTNARKPGFVDKMRNTARRVSDSVSGKRKKSKDGHKQKKEKSTAPLSSTETKKPKHTSTQSPKADIKKTSSPVNERAQTSEAKKQDVNAKSMRSGTLPPLASEKKISDHGSDIPVEICVHTDTTLPSSNSSPPKYSFCSTANHTNPPTSTGETPHLENVYSALATPARSSLSPAPVSPSPPASILVANSLMRMSAGGSPNPNAYSYGGGTGTAGSSPMWRHSSSSVKSATRGPSPPESSSRSSSSPSPIRITLRDPIDLSQYNYNVPVVPRCPVAILRKWLLEELTLRKEREDPSIEIPPLDDHDQYGVFCGVKKMDDDAAVSFGEATEGKNDCVFSLQKLSN